MMPEILANSFLFVVSVVVGLVILYMITRLIAVAWYRTKREFETIVLPPPTDEELTNGQEE